jgi:surface antigen
MKKHLFLLAPLLAISSCTTPPVETPTGLPALDGSAQAQRFAAVQYALENDQGGHPTLWQGSGDVRGSVAPLETVRSSTYGWCRDYEELITSGPKRYRLVGIACRKPGQGWLVLDVRPFAEPGPAG